MMLYLVTVLIMMLIRIRISLRLGLVRSGCLDKAQQRVGRTAVDNKIDDKVDDKGNNKKMSTTRLACAHHQESESMGTGR